MTIKEIDANIERIIRECVEEMEFQLYINGLIERLSKTLFDDIGTEG